jgi:uroporphyrinogen-III synthase
LRVLNTRPLKQAKALTQLIEAAGGIAVECPALAIEPSDKTWVDALPDLKTVETALFISANAVDCCFRVLEPEQWPASIQVLALGEATAQALMHYGLAVDLIPDQADSEHLLALSVLQAVNAKTLLLFKGEGGRTLIAKTLAARGANLHCIETYRRCLPKIDPKWLDALWRNERVDIILITSQEAMHNLFTLFGKAAHSWLCSRPCLVFSERLAREAALLGIEEIIVTEPKNILTRLHQFKQGFIHGNKQ